MDRFPTKDGLIRPHLREFCCTFISGVPLETICPSYGSKKKLVPVPGQNSLSCTCEDFLHCRLVVLTAISSNHFHEAEDMFASVQANLPHTRIIVYDIGLNINETTKLSTYCNVEIRTFDFSKYPLHVKTLIKYAWKPIIVSEVSREYEVVLYGDASLRIYRPAAQGITQHLLEFPYVPGPLDLNPITGLTHDSTLNYLGLNMSRAMAAKQIDYTIPGTLFCMWLTEVIREKLMKRWLDCALHEECIAPPGTSPYGCKFKIKGGAYIGCHRFDQSALTVILYQEFGLKSRKGLNNGTHYYWDGQRSVTNFYNVTLKTSGC